ncbi:MAG: glycosyltransferase [Aliarcobacter butzleri]|nr:glycosyltransferase [Aliarcobacter butzleri]
MISFIMMAYNVENYISDAIVELQKENEVKWELVIVDDFSTDSTFEVAKKFAEQDDRIKLVKNISKGKVTGTNYGYSLTSGDIIKCIDSDDVLLQDFFRYYDEMQKYDAHCHSSFITDNKLKIQATYEYNPLMLSKGYSFVLANLISFPKVSWSFNRKIADKVFPMPEALPFEDVWISMIVKKNAQNIFTFETPFKGVRNFLNIFKVKKLEKKIENNLNINKEDILFVYTEYEVLNQYMISLFKKAGARVYVIEDGGFPTYLTYGVTNEGGLTVKEKIKMFYVKYVHGYKFVEFLKYNNIIFPQINEKYIDGVLVYLDVSIVRKIKKVLISKNQKAFYLDNNKAIFLNETMYDYYCSKAEYKVILNDVLSKMTQKFGKVYFKFHPRETEDNKIWQLKIVNSFQDIEVINDTSPIEYLLERYNTKYVFSFLSAALLNVNAMGAIPVYIYHLYDIISKNSVFKQIDLILKNTNYNFIDKNYNVDKIGFGRIIDCDESSTLKDFINKESSAFRDS